MSKYFLCNRIAYIKNTVNLFFANASPISIIHVIACHISCHETVTKLSINDKLFQTYIKEISTSFHDINNCNNWDANNR